MKEEKLISIFLPNLHGGGAEKFIINLANNLVCLNQKVVLVVGNYEGVYGSEISKKVKVVNFKTKSKIVTFLKIMRFLIISKPNIFMSSLDLYNIKSILASKLVGFKGRLIINQRGTIGPVYENSNFIKKFLYLTLIRLTYKYANAIISNSKWTTNELKNTLNLRYDIFYTIYNSVDCKKINNLANKKIINNWYKNNSSQYIISVGSLTYLKDRITLLKAFYIVKKYKRDIKLVILGEGEKKDEIEDLIYKLDLRANVYMPGFKKNPYKWIKHSALLVSSSLTEGFPNNLLEALCLKTPIVSTDCPGGARELLDNGKWGCIVPVRNPEKMAEAMIKILSRPNINKGYLRAQDFAPQKITLKYLSVLDPNFKNN